MSRGRNQLDSIAPDLWSITRPLRFWGVETGSRMTVVRLADGSLFVHSPIALDSDLQQQLAALGPVAAVVAPSLFHHLAVGEWQAVYPDALVACCPGLERKRPDLTWDRVLDDRPEPIWGGDLDQVWFAARTMESEVVFFHRATRTMICADVLFNLARHPSWLTRIVALALWNRRPGATWLEHLMIRDRKGAREQIDRMLAWQPERIVLAHGEVVATDGEAVLRRAYAWL